MNYKPAKSYFDFRNNAKKVSSTVEKSSNLDDKSSNLSKHKHKSPLLIRIEGENLKRSITTKFTLNTLNKKQETSNLYKKIIQNKVECKKDKSSSGSELEFKEAQTTEKNKSSSGSELEFEEVKTYDKLYQNAFQFLDEETSKDRKLMQVSPNNERSIESSIQSDLSPLKSRLFIRRQGNYLESQQNKRYSDKVKNPIIKDQSNRHSSLPDELPDIKPNFLLLPKIDEKRKSQRYEDKNSLTNLHSIEDKYKKNNLTKK